jgi:hypothetical protein
MQNSVLSIRNFFNKKAPFMIQEYNTSEQKEYDSVTQRVKTEV